MIIGKRFFKAVILFLSGIILVSCGNGVSEEALARLDALGAYGAEEAAEYRIVMPSACGETVSESARKLSSVISARTGSSCITEFDNELSDSADNCFTVFLGNTSSSFTKKEFYGLKRDDYICKTYETKLILGGKSENATAAAVEKYIGEILPMCEPTVIICDGGDFEYRRDYEIDEVVLCGFDIDKYAFSFGDSAAVCDIALKLREAIADKCGYYPDTFVGQRVAERREISFSVNEKLTSVARIEFDGEDIIISSDSIYGLSYASERFYSLILDGVTDGKSTVDIAYEMNYTYFDARISLLNVISDIPADTGGVDTAVKLARYITDTDSGVVTFGTLNRDIWNVVKANVPNKYRAEEAAAENGDILPVLIDTSRYSVSSVVENTADGLFTRCFVLEDNDSRQRFELILFLNIGNADSTEAVKQRLVSDSGAYIAVFTSENYLTPLDVIGSGISVEYNSAVSLGTVKQRCAVFSSSELLSCSDVLYDSSVDTSVCTLNVDVRKNYCDAFIELVQSKNIDN